MNTRRSQAAPGAFLLTTALLVGLMISAYIAGRGRLPLSYLAVLAVLSLVCGALTYLSKRTGFQSRGVFWIVSACFAAVVWGVMFGSFPVANDGASLWQRPWLIHRVYAVLFHHAFSDWSIPREGLCVSFLAGLSLALPAMCISSTWHLGVHCRKS